MSAFAHIASEALLEARPSTAEFRRLALVYACVAAAVLFLAAIVALGSTDAQASSTVVAFIAAGLIYVLMGAPWNRAIPDETAKLRTDIKTTTSMIGDRARSVAHLRQSIAGFAGRLFDWDGMEGIAPKPYAIADALTFIDKLPSDAPLPDKVYAPGDGEVMFQWLRPGTLIEVGFYGDDTISWFARIPRRDDTNGDNSFDRRYEQRLPPALTDALSALERPA
jgi:hypothetical protein